jgi:hypothetical protein
MPGFDDVIALTADLPGVELGTSNGTPALRVGKKLMCCLRDDNETLVLKPIDEIQQRFPMETQPKVFYKTPHYEGYDIILLHLALVDETELRDLLEQTWSQLASRKLLALRDE